MADDDRKMSPTRVGRRHPNGTMTRDDIYRTPRRPLQPFEFNAAVAEVFDDMIHRSVPMYGEIIRRQAQMIAQAYRPGTRIYDLGCSTGNLTFALCSRMPAGALEMVAVDDSQPMLNLFAERLDAAGRAGDVTLLKEDIRRVRLQRASVVTINFTLQFIPPADRDRLIRRVADALIPGGLLLFSEKTVHADRSLSDLQVAYYHRFKREHGYSDLEISQKREALENVLIPETIEAHHDRLRRCGFGVSDLWLKWFNFCSWICRR
jgi:tRNA (cmo5U34)-methyltransferase